MLAAHGVERGDRVAVVLPPTAETAAIFLGTWKLGAILLSMSVLYGDEGIAHRLMGTPSRRCSSTDADNAERFDPGSVEHLLVLTDDLLAKGSASFECVDTSADDPAQL